MKSHMSTLLILAVIIAIGIFAFRGCKKMEIHQKSDDKKTKITMDVQKETNDRE